MVSTFCQARPNRGFSVRTKHNRQLRLGQMLSNAAMFAVSKAKGVFGRPFPVHVKLIGVLEDILVAISGLVGCDDALACSDVLCAC